jgi:regulation of enolase protein 1 (concanavalin A-like superfamily)
MMHRHFALLGVTCGLFVLVSIGRAVMLPESQATKGTVLLDEQFSGPKTDSRLHWLNPPPSSEVRDGWLVVTPGNETDFWQKTLDGGSRDNGHFFYVELSGDFVAETRVTGDFHNLYDQAGLMLRADATTWLKADAENDPVGSPTLGVVITRDTSDWSVSRLAPKEFMLRLERKGSLVTVYTSEDGGNWSVLRMATLDWKDPLQVGLFAACPTKSGMRARFDYLRITGPGKLHQAGE